MDFEHPPPDPIAQLQQWIEEARGTGLPNPNAMTLATCTKSGAPSTRTVLLKGLDTSGVTFFTNRQSRKGRELNENPRASLLFFWDALNRQVRIDGRVSKVSDAESDAYFATRLRGSQIGAWASRQSEVVGSRAELDAAAADAAKRFEGKPVPRPPHWGGYRVSPDSIEFWQGHPFRLHDRIVYTRDETAPNGWRVQRLWP